MRPDYLDTMQSSHTSFLDWSLQSSKKEAPFQIKNNQWELLGEIDVASHSPKPQHTTTTTTTTTTPNQRPRRHRCISDDTEATCEEPQHDSCPEREWYDLKPKSLTACFESTTCSSSFDDEPLPILNFDAPPLRSKRSRDCLESSSCSQEDQGDQVCDRQQPPLRKRRRVAGRNNALCAQDYNEIFSQIGC